MPRQSSRFLWLEVCLAITLIALASIEVLIYSPPIQRIERTLGVQLQTYEADPQSPRLKLGITHGPADRNLRLVAYPLLDKPIVQRSIFVLVDNSYPTANVIERAVQGVLDHLSGELLTYGYPRSIKPVAAAELRQILLATGDADHEAIVMMTGVLPSVVFSQTLDLLTPWVEAGGLVIWGGGTIGFWSGSAGQPLSSAGIIGEPGTVRLLGKGVVKYPTVSNRLGSTPSDFAAALDISYQFTGSGVQRDPILARGGKSLGWFSGPFSSVTYIVRGNGGYLVFGGEIIDEVSVSHDLSRMILAGAIYSSGPIASKPIDLSQTSATSVVDWDLPFTVPKGGLMLVAFDPTPDSVFFFTQRIR